jgi:Ca2+-binding RTX toxin-like protein
MSKTFDPNIAKQYTEKLAPTAEQIKQHHRNGKPAPTQAELNSATKIAQEYYNYLIDTGIPYGKAAKDAANNQGAYGRLANQYFKMQAKAEGKTADQIPLILDQLKIRLAFDDANTRSDPYSIDSQGNIIYNTIANYHYKNLEIFKLSKHAWGGTFFEEFAGSGSWMDFGGYDTKVDIKQIRLLEALATNRKVDGVSAWEYVNRLKNLGIENKADTTTAILYRTALGLEDNSITHGPNGEIFVKGMNEAQISKKFNIPVDRIMEDYGFNEDLQGRPTGQKRFIIVGDKKSTTNANAEGMEGYFHYAYETLKNKIFESYFQPSRKENDPHSNPHHDAPSKSTYTVKAGDTLWAIAKKAGVPMKDILMTKGNEKFLARAELSGEDGVKHLLLKEDDVILLPESKTEIYEGSLIDKQNELLGKTTKPSVQINEESLEPPAFMRILVKEEQKEQMEFLLRNVIKFDPACNNIYKFTLKVLDNLFLNDESAEKTGKTISERLVKGDKIENISKDLLKNAVAKTTVDMVNFPFAQKLYDEVFTNSIGKEILGDFATSLIATADKHHNANDYRIMAYAAANKIVTQKAVNHMLSKQSAALQSAAAAGLTHITMGIISHKGKMDESAWKHLGATGLATFVGSYVGSTAITYAAAATGSSILASGLISGLASGGIGAVVTIALCSLMKPGRKKISTYIESHKVRVNEDGKLEFVTMRPEGTTLVELGNTDKIIYGLGQSDHVLTGAGNDEIILIGKAGGFVEAGDNRPRQPIKIQDKKTGQEVESYIYLEKVIGGDGSDNKLDGQDGDDYINGRGGNDKIRGGNGHDLLEGGEGDDDIEGNDGNDTIYGDEGNDLIDGGAGDDEIFAGDGDDGTSEKPIKGGRGNDIISGGSGNDIIDGGKGDDIVSGDDGKDTLFGGDGNDFIYGGDGDDLLYGQEGNDNLEGGEGNDVVAGGIGHDLLKGDNGDDSLLGDQGDDLIYGGDGDDSIIGGAGNDTMYGGVGNDRYFYKVQERATDKCANGNNLYIGDGDDIIEDLAGEENVLIIENKDIKPADLNFTAVDQDLKIAFSGREGSILLRNFANNQSIKTIQLYGYRLDTGKINLAFLQQNFAWEADTNFSQEVASSMAAESPKEDISAWQATIFDDQQFASLQRNLRTNEIQIVSQKHNRHGWCGKACSSYHTYHPHYPPRLEGTEGIDKLVGNYWNEHILGKGGDDEIYGNNGNDYIQGGTGNDKIDGGNGNDVLYGEDGNDKITGGADNDKLYGGNGKDELHGEWGNDELYGGDDDDSLNGDDGDDILHGENGNDIILGGIGNDRIYAGPGNDKASGGEGDDEAHGEDGDDIIVGNAGNDILHGGQGNDHLFGGDGNDQLHGDDGDDYLLGGEGDDEIHGGQGNDRIFGGFETGNVNECKQFDDIKEKLGLENFCATFSSSLTERNTLYGGAGDDYIRGNSGPDYLDGGEGDDEMDGGPGDDILKGGDGNDAIYGGAGNDHLYADAPYTILGWQPKNQLLVGGLGKDAYYYEKGFGHVEIADCGYQATSCQFDQDILKFGPGIGVEDISITQTGLDAYITFNNGWHGSVTIKKQFGQQENRLGKMQFADGFEVDIANLSVGTDYADNMPSSNAQTVFANLGDDEVSAQGNQSVFASYGDDTIRVSKVGGKYHGGYGKDTYIIDSNVSKVVINEISDNKPNTVKFVGNIRIQDLLPNISSHSLDFTSRDAMASYSITSTAQGILPMIRIGNDMFDFAINSIEQVLYIPSRVVAYDGQNKVQWLIPTSRDTITIRGGNYSDIIIAHPQQDTTLKGNDGDDVLIGNTGNDYIVGGKGDDIIYGDAGTDIIKGEEGDDLLYGGEGKDTFTYSYSAVSPDENINHGKDIIYRFNCSEDKIELTAFRFKDIGFFKSLIANVTSDSMGNAIIEHIDYFHITLVGINKEQVTPKIFTHGYNSIEVAEKYDNFAANLLPKLFVKKWVMFTGQQFMSNPFQSWDDINFPTSMLLELPPYMGQKEIDIMNRVKRVAVKEVREDIINSLPLKLQYSYSEYHEAYSAIRSSPKALPDKELSINLEKAAEKMAKTCNLFSEYEICRQYDSSKYLLEPVLTQLAINEH